MIDELRQCGLFDLSHLELLVEDIWIVLESDANPKAKGFTFYGSGE